MMDGSRWRSAADVEADLSRVGAAPERRELAAACLAWGARPAAHIIDDEELEQNPSLLLGEDSAPPDLQGITAMLRMVQTHDDSGQERLSPEPTAAVISKPTALVVSEPAVTPRSNLNPDVGEFVPKCRSSRGEPFEPTGDTGARGVCDRDSSESDRYRTEREELAAMLQAPKDGDSRLLRRHKYDAIASFLKLPAPAFPVPAAPRLCTPDYFQRTAGAAPPATSSDPSREIDTKIVDAVGSESTPPTTDLSSGIKSVMLDPLTSGDGVDLADVRTSVVKVTNWLEGAPLVLPPAPAPSPRLHLGPVGFRRREPGGGGGAGAPAASPARRGSPPRAFDAGAGAARLRSEYQARAQANAPPPAPRSLWDTLEEELRRKDEEIRSQRSDTTSS